MKPNLAMRKAALTLVRDASRTCGARCPACGWNEPRWIASHVGNHIRTCDALAAQSDEQHKENK